jgi:apolipoprotein D and lipocalin family protein
MVISLLVVLVCFSGCTTTFTQRMGLPPLTTVEQVDLLRYTGTWYEIARFPHSFQEGCTATTATYAVRTDGGLDVTNRCLLHRLDGEEKMAHGRARVIDSTSNAKLEVSFFWPFWGDYWIIDLDPAYRFAVVGHPSRDYLWILGRSPTMNRPTYKAIIARLKDQGYETQRLMQTLHP